MQRSRGVKIIAVVAITSVVAAAGAWTLPAAAQRDSTVKTVDRRVSCQTAKGALQIYVFAYRPSLKYAAAEITTGAAGTAAITVLVGAQTDKANYTLSKACSQTKVPVRFTHRGLRSAGVIKAGYYQWPTVYCGVPGRVLLHYRIGFDSSGKPATATLSAWAKPRKSSRLREIGYAQWSRNRSVSYYSPKACVAQ